jgi:hypothetical protein
VDVSFTRIIFLLCDGECRAPAPAGAVVLRHNGHENNWGVSEPVFEPTGRHRSRIVL